jgi:ribose transport system substrate-binding protein
VREFVIQTAALYNTGRQFDDQTDGGVSSKENEMKTAAWKVSAILSVAAGLVMLVAGCGKGDNSSQVGTNPQPAQPTKLKIAVIPKGTTHDYWKSVHAGADAAAKDLGVTIDYQGPLKEDDVTNQQNIVEQFTADKENGIVLAPLSDSALLVPVQSAMAKKIPVVVIDSALGGTAGTDYVSYVSTNNHQGGVMAGDQMVKLLGGKGKLVMLRYASFSASTNEREAGFMDAIKAANDKSPGSFTWISNNQHAGATESEAQQTAENMLDDLKQADGVYCPNESSTMGMLKALQENNLTGKKIFVGFDATTAEVDALKAGLINALVSQNPYRMGYLGVQTCVAAIKGQKVDLQQDSGVKLVTPENVNDPDMVKFLNPG